MARNLKIAVMQPYFAPYLGYFRLAVYVDLFVIFDCVQFPRRGWVHRNRLHDRTGKLEWLTLPLRKAPFDAAIRAIRFRERSEATFGEDCRRFAATTSGPAAGLLGMIGPPPSGGLLVDHLERTLLAFHECLGIRTPMLRSSSLEVPAHLAGQERILEICRRLGASAYLNAPGGRQLYDPAAFARSGVALDFLPPYNGPPASVLDRIAAESPAALSAELLRGHPGSPVGDGGQCAG